MAGGKPHFTHVVVGVTHALAASELEKIDAAKSWRILHYSDSNSLGGTPSFSFTLPGRAAIMEDGSRKPWRELLNAGDLVQAGGWMFDGENRDKVPATMADGYIKSVSSQESYAGGYDYTTTVQCMGFQDILMQDSVAWWMFYGHSDGWSAARSKLLPDDMSGAIEVMLKNYLDKVVFTKANWERGGYGIGSRMGYQLRSLGANAPISTNLALAEGTHWGIMSEFLDNPLHEMYTTVRPAGHTPKGGGQVHRPDAPAEKAIVGQLVGDGARTWLEMRPAPYPYCDKNGKIVMTDWEALPLHDYSDKETVFGERGHDVSDDGVRNYIMVYPSFQAIDESMTYTCEIAVHNEISIRRYAYRPFKLRTHLVMDDGPKENPLTLAKKLTWRMAAQLNRMDALMNGSLTTYLDPHVRVGERVCFRDPHGDQTDKARMQGHIVSVSRSWNPESGGTTTLGLNRVTEASTYENKPEWFAEGLAPIELDISPTAPSAAPEAQ